VSAVLVVAVGGAALLGLALVAFWAGPLTAVAVAFAGFGLLHGAVAYGDGAGGLLLALTDSRPSHRACGP